MARFPRVPFVPAEEHVNWSLHESEILNARYRVEQTVLPRLRRAAVLIQTHNAAPMSVQRDISESMRRSLERTARFGYREVQRETISQRGGAPPTTPVADPQQQNGNALLLALLIALGLHGPRLSPKSLLRRLRRSAAEDQGGRLRRYSISGVGEHAHVVVDGWGSVTRLLGDRAEQVARDVVSAMLGRHARLDDQAKRASGLADLLAEGGRVLHNETLEPSVKR